MLIGRDSELLRLRQTILDRRSLLVYGNHGSGKTELLRETLKTLPDSVRKECIVCGAPESLHDLLRELSKLLAAAGDPQILSRVEKEVGDLTQIERWIFSQTSLRLRGVLRQAARERPYSIFLEVPGRLPDNIYRLLQGWVWSGRTPVVILACGPTERELGRSSRLFWHDGLRMELCPLSRDAANQLLNTWLMDFGLKEISGKEFREFVLQESKCLPGPICLLCELAQNPAYRYGGRIKLHTLRIDFRMKQSGFSSAGLRVTNHA